MGSMIVNSNFPDEGDTFADSIRVLIVDDDPGYVALLSRYIEKNKIYSSVEIDSCENAGSAITLYATGQYDVLLVDHNLPDMYGAKLLGILQENNDELAPPAIVLTAEGGLEAARSAIKANAYDFIPKDRVNCGSLARSMDNTIVKYRLMESNASRAKQLEQLNIVLNEKNREINEFYQTISHEVKTPLSATREFISILRDGIVGEVSGQQIEILEHALAGCDQLAAHLNDLVELTRLDARKIILRRKQVSINRILTRSVASCARAAEDNGVLLTQDLKNIDLELYVDENRITQVLSNVISNAVKYSDEGSAVLIGVRCVDEVVCFSISDTGCGIADENLTKIFQRLYQVNDFSHEYAGAGLGLGLSISKEIVALHHGEIEVESSLGEGTTFYIRLPVYHKNNKKENNEQESTIGGR